MLSAIFNLEVVYVLSGIVLIVFAVFTAMDEGNPTRYGTALFWLLLGVVFAFAAVLPSWVIGALVLGMVALDGVGWVRHGSYDESTHEHKLLSADRLGWRLFVPVLMIPAVTYAATLALSGSGIDGNKLVFSSLGYASVLAGLVAWFVTRDRPIHLVHEGRRLADAIGAVVILPQLLASLGVLFTKANVGTVIAEKVALVAPTDSLFAVVVLLCVTIALFTFIMGNSFAAFPVIMGGIGVPLLVRPFHVDAALVGALAITAASCGTLCTPMAANFNLVPPALFEMKNRYGVIRFQAPFAAAMLVVHILLLWALAVYL